MNKFSLDTHLKKRLNKIKETYKWWNCNLIVMNGELLIKDSKGMTQIFVDSDTYLDKVEELLVREEKKRKKRTRKRIIQITKTVALSAALLGTAISGLAVLKREGEYDAWKAEQMQIDGVVDYVRNGPYGPEYVAKKGTDMNKYSKEEYKKAKREEKGHGR